MKKGNARYFTGYIFRNFEKVREVYIKKSDSANI